jgi:hypothetical protein
VKERVSNIDVISITSPDRMQGVDFRTHQKYLFSSIQFSFFCGVEFAEE